MKSCSTLLCFLLAAIAMTVAGPARHQRAADDTDNSIDIDTVKIEDITTDMIAEAKSEPPAPTDLELTSPAEQTSETNPALTLPPRPAETESDEEDDIMENSPSNNRGNNIFSLLNLVGQLFPGSSGSNMRVRNLFQNFLTRNPLAIASIERYINGMIMPNRRQFVVRRRQDIKDNEIEIDEEVSGESSEEKTEENESSEEESKESAESSMADSKRKSGERQSQEIEEEEDNNAAEESGEVANEKQSDEESESESDYDEPPGGGDGGGGGILGVIAGLSGGEDGQSDLGSLLATVSGIVVQLSGDGVDVNGLIASALGLFVGLLSEGMENPGSIVASYINTALDTLSGGGSKNNGAFFGNFAGKILRGISMAPEGSSEEGGFKKGGGFDSAGFFLSLLMGFSGASSGKGMGMGEE